MSQLQRDDTGTRGLERIFRAQLEGAAAVLSRRRVTDEQVHDARKQLKKARATLRLLRDELGRLRYARANGALRDAARPLSSVRDARVLPEALDALVARHRRGKRALVLTRLRDALLRALAHERKGVTPRHVAALAGRVRAVVRRSARWRTGRQGWTVPGAGLARTYRHGREAYAAAHSRTTPDLHEWRKQVKYLRYQLNLLEPLSPAIIGELADNAHALTECLGEDHDLAVLEQRIHDVGARVLDADARETLLALIDRRRRRLQDKAFVIGRRLYAERLQEWRRRFGRYWHAWRNEGRPARKQDVRRRSNR